MLSLFRLNFVDVFGHKWGTQFRMVTCEFEIFCLLNVIVTSNTFRCWSTHDCVICFLIFILQCTFIPCKFCFQIQNTGAFISCFLHLSIFFDMLKIQWGQGIWVRFRSHYPKLLLLRGDWMELSFGQDCQPESSECCVKILPCFI
jgi:hypothetical protein